MRAVKSGEAPVLEVVPSEDTTMTTDIGQSVSKQAPVLTAVEQAEAEVARFEAAARHWHSVQVGVERQLADALKGAGASVLDDPSAADRISETSGQLERRAEMAAQAVAEAVRRHQVASRDLIMVRADAMDAPIAEGQAKLEDHISQVAAAMAELEQVSGCEWRELRIEDHPGYGQGGRVSIKTSTRRRLESVVSGLRAEQARLRDSVEDVQPLRLADRDLVEASLRVLDAGGEVSERSWSGLGGRVDELEVERRELLERRREVLSGLGAAFGWPNPSDLIDSAPASLRDRWAGQGSWPPAEREEVFAQLVAHRDRAAEELAAVDAELALVEAELGRMVPEGPSGAAA